MLFVLSFGAAAQGKGPADAVRALDARRMAAMVKSDVAELGKLLADDLTYVHTTGEAETKKEFLASLSSGRLRYESLTPSDVRVQMFGDTAVVTGRAEAAVQAGGRAARFALRFTDVWVRRGGRWQMVAWQSTRLP